MDFRFENFARIKQQFNCISTNDDFAHGFSTRITRRFRGGAGNYVEIMWFGNFVIYIRAVATVLLYQVLESKSLTRISAQINSTCIFTLLTLTYY